MAQTRLIGTNYIVKTPGVLGGEPHIDGKRISVSMLVELHIIQHTPIDEIIALLPVTPSEVYSALAYYYDHREEIEGILQQQEQGEHENVDARRQAQLEARAKGLADTLVGQEREMTVTEIVETYGVTAPVVREAASKGWIPARKSGSTWLIRKHEAEERWGKS